MTTYLNELLPGQSAEIVKIEDDSTLKRRLIELGLREGKEVLMKRDAPMGDPMEISVMGYNISLRKSEARYVMISNVHQAVHIKEKKSWEMFKKMLFGRKE